jgi:hypothetical protein
MSDIGNADLQARVRLSGPQRAEALAPGIG